MREAAIIGSIMIVGIGLIYLVIAILPFLIAIGCIVFIYWMLAKCLVGGFSPWDRK
jgi:hypothetical protein